MSQGKIIQFAPGVDGLNLMRSSRISSCLVQGQPKPGELEVISLPQDVLRLHIQMNKIIPTHE